MHLLCVVYFFCSLFKIESGAKNTKISTNSLKKPLKKGWIFCFKKGCVKKMVVVSSVIFFYPNLQNPKSDEI